MPAYAAPEAEDLVTDAAAGGAAAPEAEKKPRKLRYDDEGFLRLVRDERARSIGFGEGDNGELQKVRIRAQEYRQGKIRDLTVLEGRSQAVDSSLSDACDTVMPDVMEVFFGGDDVVTFDADNEGDEAQAREESDVLKQVVFGQNDAFRSFHDAFQDAFLNRTGIFYWWWEEDEVPIGETVAENAPMAAAVAQLVGEKFPWAQAEWDQREDGTITLAFKELRGRACFKAVPSEDFSVSANTVVLRDTPYCVLRDRPQVQDLIARGVEKTLARSLPAYQPIRDEESRARDQAGEDEQVSSNGIDDLRVVEVRCHYIRVDADDDGQPEIWRVETDAEETKILQKEKVSQIPFGALTPYLNAHRFYGEGLYDKLQEVMRIKTVLMRMLLDSGYFALNQRFEVSEASSNEFTLTDLLNNAPNVPVRSRDGNAVRALTAGQLGFDVFSALEHMAVVAEQRSGVVRNAQGLNPDTLHKTAMGVQQLVTAAQKRVRMIARVFAETGVKDLFLGIHQMLREHSTEKHAPLKKKIGKAWTEARPAEWSQRQAVTIHVGVGSAGLDRDLEVQERALALTEKLIALQGGVNGPFITPQNIYNRLKAYSRAAGERDPSLYFTDPGEGPLQAPGGDQPSPEVLKVQAEIRAAQMKLQGEQQLAQMKLQGELQLQAAKIDAELALERARAGADIQLQREESAATRALEALKLFQGDPRPDDVTNAREALPGGMG